jgi:hypothetical protein
LKYLTALQLPEEGLYTPFEILFVRFGHDAFLVL